MFAIDRFARRLKEVRQSMALSQEALSYQLGISRMSYSYYENGQRTPGVDFLYNLHAATGYPVEYLLGISDNKTYETLNLDSDIGLTSEAIERLRRSPKEAAIVNYILSMSQSKKFFDSIAQYIWDSRCAEAAKDPYQDVVDPPIPEVWEEAAEADLMRAVIVIEKLFGAAITNPACKSLISRVLEASLAELHSAPSIESQTIRGPRLKGDNHV